ncbi:unnamed protein product [Pleuronectes platessa]|uniref:Uncharacterized protein n=1 Tax=Pleuronectes platessa TaxID=8262 RepID=A0A9N7Z9B0_PLEPL|nr:unnamed protein product [Pleuronectes platessa]
MNWEAFSSSSSSWARPVRGSAADTDFLRAQSAERLEVTISRHLGPWNPDYLELSPLLPVDLQLRPLCDTNQGPGGIYPRCGILQFKDNVAQKTPALPPSKNR